MLPMIPPIAPAPSRRGAIICAQVFGQRLRAYRQRHGLEPHLARSGERHEVEPVAAEEHVGDAGHLGDLELDRALEHPDMTRVDEQRLPRRKLVAGQFAGQLDPGPALARQLLQDESVAAKQAPRKDCCSPTLGVMPAVPHRNPCRCTK